MNAFALVVLGFILLLSLFVCLFVLLNHLYLVSRFFCTFSSYSYLLCHCRWGLVSDLVLGWLAADRGQPSTTWHVSKSEATLKCIFTKSPILHIMVNYKNTWKKWGRLNGHQGRVLLRTSSTYSHSFLVALTCIIQLLYTFLFCFYFQFNGDRGFILIQTKVII